MAIEEPTQMESGGDPPADSSSQEEIPRGQIFFDNIWLLLVISLAISLLAYNIWGLLDLAAVPQATP